MENKGCLECQTSFFGRTDKKFCSDNCRNTYNNRVRSEDTTLIREVNSILKRNRRILAAFNPDGKTVMLKNKLIAKGFNFSYFTNIYKTNAGKEYYFCYEQGYLLIDEDKVKLVMKQEYVS